MLLIPIDIDKSKNEKFRNIEECVQILDVYPGFYQRVGFNKPWIGYFASLDGNEIVGCGGFKGKPIDGKIEIAYATFKGYEGQGMGTEICRQLVLLSLQTDPAIRITARTLPENNASTKILRRNGFEMLGIVYDEEDGNVWEWELKTVDKKDNF
jgi:RimJ/RimL family protein N-acetyltransferase